MTPEQRAMARALLGLPNATGMSTGRMVVCNAEHARWLAWEAMVTAGLAFGFEVQRGGRYRDAWGLKPAAALAALDPGERLDPTDWPGLGDYEAAA